MIALKEGSVVAGRYQLERRLARGAMGALWVARHLQLDVRVAVKFIDPALTASPEARARFEREARSAAQIQSPHVVRVLDHGVDAGTPYIAMELLIGEDLAARLERVGQLSPAVASVILAQIARGLQKAHEAGIVHRDLKPANVFLVEDQSRELAKILDFGVAKSLNPAGDGSADPGVTRTGEMVGSPQYMSPEQVRRASDVDHRSDLWSLGVILFRALTGRAPFDGDSVGDVLVGICTDPIPLASSVRPGLHSALDRFFARALARDPADRFSSAREMASAFDAAAAVIGFDAAAASALGTPVPSSGRGPRASSSALGTPVPSSGHGLVAVGAAGCGSEGFAGRPELGSGADSARGASSAAILSVHGASLPGEAALGAAPTGAGRRSIRPGQVVAAASVILLGCAAVAWVSRSNSRRAGDVGGVLTATISENGARQAPPHQVEAKVEAPRAAEDMPAAAPVPGEQPKQEWGTGYLTIECVPYCVIFVNGRHVGKSPILRRPLSPGPYQVELQTRGVATSRSAEVVSGQEQRIRWEPCLESKTASPKWRRLVGCAAEERPIKR